MVGVVVGGSDVVVRAPGCVVDDVAVEPGVVVVEPELDVVVVEPDVVVVEPPGCVVVLPTLVVVVELEPDVVVVTSGSVVVVIGSGGGSVGTTRHPPFQTAWPSESQWSPG